MFWIGMFCCINAFILVLFGLNADMNTDVIYFFCCCNRLPVFQQYFPLH